MNYVTQPSYQQAYFADSDPANAKTREPRLVLVDVEQVRQQAYLSCSSLVEYSRLPAVCEAVVCRLCIMTVFWEKEVKLSLCMTGCCESTRSAKSKAVLQ